jgi:signal transduction histidine kinase
MRRAERMGKLSAHTDQIREDERTRISREIHDELGQSLTVLKMDLAWLKARFSRQQAPLLERANCMDLTLDQLIQSVRRISSELGPPVLLELGLIPAIEWQLEQFEKRSGITCRKNVYQSELTLSKERSTVIFRVVQETLTNVARHSGATLVDFTLDVREGFVFIRIEDNGVGIKQSAIHNPSSLGLSGMRERTSRVNGYFFIEGPGSGGTRVTVRVPLEDKQSA